jgi:hypothetical protein
VHLKNVHRKHCCFPIATKVMRTSHSVALYVHCLSCSPCHKTQISFPDQSSSFIHSFSSLSYDRSKASSKAGCPHSAIQSFLLQMRVSSPFLNPLNPELNPISYFLALLGAHHFLHVSRIRVKLLTFGYYCRIYILSTHS